MAADTSDSQANPAGLSGPDGVAKTSELSCELVGLMKNHCLDGALNSCGLASIIGSILKARAETGLREIKQPVDTVGTVLRYRSYCPAVGPAGACDMDTATQRPHIVGGRLAARRLLRQL